MTATKVKKQTSSSVDDMKRKGKKKMSDDDQTQTDVEPDPSIGIGAILESIQGSLTALAITSLRSTLKKAPQQLSPLLVVLDQLSPPPILPPASVIPVKRDLRDELGVVTPIGFFDPIGKVSQIHTTPSSNHRPTTRLGGSCFLLSSTQWTGRCEISADHRVGSSVSRGMLDDE
jgi:hypothetical protein